MKCYDVLVQIILLKYIMLKEFKKCGRNQVLGSYKRVIWKLRGFGKVGPLDYTITNMVFQNIFVKCLEVGEMLHIITCKK